MSKIHLKGVNLHYGDTSPYEVKKTAESFLVQTAEKKLRAQGMQNSAIKKELQLLKKKLSI